MDVEQLMKLIDKVSESDLTGFKYEENGIKLQLNKKENLVMGTTAAVQAVTPEAVKVTGASSKAATDLEEGVQKQTGTSEAAPVGNVVKAPLVGTFYAAPAEDAEPFIQVGDSVKKGQSVAIIEAMKLMNEIESDFDGTVTEILVKNGQAVEYGLSLIHIWINFYYNIRCLNLESFDTGNVGSKESIFLTNSFLKILIEMFHFFFRDSTSL